jgi:hypothetical protein
MDNYLGKNNERTSAAREHILNKQVHTAVMSNAFTNKPVPTEMIGIQQ